MRFRNLRITLVLYAASGLGLSPARAAVAGEDSPPGAIVELPPLVVNALVKTSAWRHTDVPGMEVLSNTSDRITRDFILANDRLHQLLGQVLPPEFQSRMRAPRLLILSSREKTPSMEQDILAGFAAPPNPGRGAFRAAGAPRATAAPRATVAPRATAAPRAPAPQSIAPNQRGGTRADNLGRIVGFDPLSAALPAVAARGPTSPFRVLSNLRLADVDYSATFAIIQESTFNADQLRISPSQIRAYLADRAPPLPAWFIAGFGNLYDRMTFERDVVTIGPPHWAPHPGVPSETAGVLTNIDYPRVLMPMRDFFEIESPSDEDAPLWQSQSALFLRWGLDSRENGGAGKDALWKFVRLAADHAVTEGDLRACFGLGYADLRDRLSDYLPAAVKNPITIRAPALARPPGIGFREAYKSEIAWAQGEWARLAVRYVAERYPVYASRYSERAMATFAEATAANATDPRFAGTLGLFEIETGNVAAARPHLETAVGAAVDRPLLNIDLAQLRFAEAREKPEGREGRLSAGQADLVLAPLAAGTAFEPPLLSAYRLVGEVRLRSDSVLAPADFALLESGVRYFPADASLLYATAALRGRQGYAAESRALVDRGLAMKGLAPDQRAAFERLRAALP